MPSAPLRDRTPAFTPEALAAVASLFWLLSANGAFFEAALHGRSAQAASTWAFGLALAVLLFALHLGLLLLVCTRWTTKPVIAALLPASAAGTWFVQSFRIYLDPSMLRNVLSTNPAEAGELLTPGLMVHLLLYAGLPIGLLFFVRLRERRWAQAARTRLLALAAVAVVLVAALASMMQPFASLMRNHKEVRYLITPANLVWSTGSVLLRDVRGAARPRQPLSSDPVLQSDGVPRARVVVLVVGETARAANWGLSGYARQTTPLLAGLDVLNFAEVTSCGTNTETSLPCMFAPVGRRQYDEDRIRGSESLLHLVDRAGVRVHWRDNQSGCKGVCDDLPQDEVQSLNPAGLCDGGQCLDEGLLSGLDERLVRADAQGGTHLWVLHMLGNHGPSYSRRYPKAFSRFEPACRNDDLSRCSREEIVNAYDNALLYTDHVLAELVAMLKARSDRVDSTMVFVSDHGESLGEKGLFLHGMPYAIAPQEQTRVPMVMWWSAGWARREGLDAACLRARAASPASHDHLFHTLLGLLRVKAREYEAPWDLSAGCTAAPAAPR